MNAKKARSAKSAKSLKTPKGAKSTSYPINMVSAEKAKTYKVIMYVSIAVNVLLIAALIFLLVERNASSDTPVDVPADTQEDTTEAAFSYSDGIDENGFWEGIRALDYVKLFDYLAISIPRDVHKITDEALQAEIENMLTSYSPEVEEITDRAVVEGDSVNIDFVGTIDGVEFEGGSTEGAGADYTAGSAELIDDFLTQIIGHMPGETITVEVTFPEDYGREDLNGKEAVFMTTINYIAEYHITDEFIAENFFESNGWATINEMEAGLREILQETAIKTYVSEYLISAVTISEIPYSIMKYQENLMVTFYQSYADMYGVSLVEYLQNYVGVSSVDELLETQSEDNIQAATSSLAIQAIAEDAGISVDAEDMNKYLPDYASYEAEYGMPYLKQHVLGQKVLSLLVDNAILE
jgi:trigger factor